MELTSPLAVDPGNRAEFVDRAAQSVKWSFLYNALPRLITPFSTMILAALLTPADFGLVAISTLVIALAQIVVGLGLGRTVIQRSEQVAEAASSALWVSMLVSGVLYLVLWLVAPNLAVAYKNAQVVDVIRVAALALPLSSLLAIPTALLHRGMEFRRLFWINSSILVVSATASVILAVLGAGAWALIWGPLFGMAVSTYLAWRLSAWRPMFAIHGLVLRSMLGFSSWVMAAGFLNWMFLYAGNTIGGLFLGVEGLGVFSLGFTIAIVIPSFLVAAIGDVTYPAFCRMQGNPRNIGEDLVKVQALAGSVLFPVTLGISAIAPTVIHLLYGSKWAGLGTVISILVIMPGMGHVWSLNENAYQAIGRPDLWTKVSALSLLFMLPVLWLLGHHGLMAFTLGRFGAGWILPLGNIYLSARILKVGIRSQIKAFGPPLLISLGMFVWVALLTRLGSTFEGVIGWIKLLAIVFIGGATYLGLVRIFQKRLWDQMFLSLRRAFL